MSVDLNFYVINGIRIEGYDASLVKKLDENNLGIGDYMTSKFMIIGDILYNSGNVFNDYPDCTSMLMGVISNREQAFRNKFIQFLPEYSELIEGKDFSLNFVPLYA